jgi:hypothetical protein
MLHVSVIRPSSSRDIFARTYSTDNGSIVFRILVNIMNNYSDRLLIGVDGKTPSHTRNRLQTAKIRMSTGLVPSYAADGVA